MKNATSMRMLLAAGALIHLVAAPAVAQPAPATAQPRTSAAPEAADTPETDDHPWSRGVSKEQQQKARELYDAGTRALKDMRFDTAAARYREALGYWDHPGIHYHLAIALINLKQPIEAYRSLLAALRYDGTALDDGQHRQALSYKALLQQRVATLELACAEPGASVLLDGEQLLTGPGQIEHLVLPGEHQVVVRKPGHQTRTEPLVLPPGIRTAVDVQQRPELLARWIPWAVVGAGVAAGGMGGLLHWRADVHMDEFDKRFAAQCSGGCRADNPESPMELMKLMKLMGLMEHARWKQRAAVGAYAAGAGLVVAGLVLAWINPERSFFLDERRASGEPFLVPSVSPTSAGLTVNTSF